MADMTYREAVAEGIAREMRRDSDILFEGVDQREHGDNCENTNRYAQK